MMMTISSGYKQIFNYNRLTCLKDLNKYINITIRSHNNPTSKTKFTNIVMW